MMEFTKEWIAKQKKKLDGYTTEGVFENPNVDYSFELDILQEHYPEALDEISRLQARVAELEAEREQTCEWKADRADDYYDTSCNDFYRKKIIDDYLGGKLYCKFCPSCGKRIKYVEES